MVCPGYEPDLYTPETAGKSHEVRGTTKNFRDMRANFDRIFKEEGVNNVVWVMDFSWNIRDHPDMAVELWPDVDNVSWLFWNMFQFSTIDTDVGDCVGGYKNIYQAMTDRSE